MFPSDSDWLRPNKWISSGRITRWEKRDERYSRLFALGIGIAMLFGTPTVVIFALSQAIEKNIFVHAPFVAWPCMTAGALGLVFAATMSVLQYRHGLKCPEEEEKWDEGNCNEDIRPRNNA